MAGVRAYLNDNWEEKFVSKVPEKNISAVMEAFKEFRDKNFTEPESVLDIKVFTDFMEPKFAEAGYRENFDPSPAKTKDANILILTDLGVGDFMVSTGAIREVRRIYPEAHITLVSYKKPFSFAEVCPYVDEVILCDKYTSKFPRMYNLVMETAEKLLERCFDLCFSFSIHAFTNLLTYMSGAKIRLISIYQRNLNRAKADAIRKSNLLVYSKLLATHLIPYGDTRCHMADRFFLLPEETLRAPISNRKLEAWYTFRDFSVALESLGNVSGSLYSLCMGGVWGRVHYPPEKYARLLELIAEEDPSARFVILGGGDKDLESAEVLKTASPELYEKKVTNLVNKLTYRQTAAAMSFCKIHIGNDTGTSHVAAGVNCPVLSPNCFAANFKMRNTDAPGRWAPYAVPSVIVFPERALDECNSEPYGGHGCKIKEVPHCITQIAPETLFKGFHLLIQRAAEKINEPLYIS